MIFQNKQNWKPTAIGEIAFEYSKRCDNPSNSGYDKFVGSENIDRFDYKVKNWQSTDDVISAMKLFEKDDYLLVRRSLYASDFRERAPRADFDGVCSGDILTIKENEQKIANGFLYCILNSKQVWEFIVANASGSITRRIKWPELSKLQIPLPPLSEQKQIAALFQSLETAMEQVDGQEKNLKALQKNLVNSLVSTEPFFGNLLNRKNCTPNNIGAIAECDKKYPEHEKEVERFVGLENIEPENFQLQGFGLVANGTTFTKRFAKGDVLFGKRRAYLKKVAVADFDGICSGDILVIRAKVKKMLQGLLPYYISADAFINHAVSTSAGSLSPRTKWKDLETFEIAIPDLKTQEKILEVLQQLDNTIQQLKQQKATLKLLKQKLLNEILG
jgi:type I restriction enzyme S subunit